MATWLRYGLAALLIVAAGIGLATTSEARSILAFFGQPQSPSDYACFTNSGGAVFNSCGVTKRFCIGLPYAGHSLHTVEMNVLAPDINHNISCFASAATRDHQPVVTSGFLSPTSFGVSQTLTFPRMNLPAAGALYACCDLAPSASLQSLNW
jgi:hypothetical protein